MSSALRLSIERRAGERCEYCQAPQRVCGYRFHLEHIVPSARGGSNTVENRALACASCNLAKGDKLVAVDPAMGLVVELFNPRKHSWTEHFHFSSDRQRIDGITPVGRATSEALCMNTGSRMQARSLWFVCGYLP
jgi:HNH endonuclease